jgi:hypothetical protein|tara:strand:+ start:1371 stop:2051 length:681 start_codon:yes stop_codon:yes gene_type:complete
MRIYTGTAFGEKFKKVKELGLGIMISTFDLKSFRPEKYFGEVPCALDNGVFNCYRKGYPFQADLFLKNIAHCYKIGIKLDFIVCPDIMCAGTRSLEYSLMWARGELATAPNLALVVQDGMRVKDIESDLEPNFTHIFVGGSVEWKWKSVDEWVGFAKDRGLKSHIGQCGQKKYLEKAFEMGVDSVDSSSIVRNKSWEIIEHYQKSMKGAQKDLFKAKEEDTLSFVQ